MIRKRNAQKLHKYIPRPNTQYNSIYNTKKKSYSQMRTGEKWEITFCKKVDDLYVSIKETLGNNIK